ncbi:hypothetical protein Acsp02_95100 [Actinoplanes sp. NBRC 103695]|nr:hypothetical protein Acsp02_95100 [Actinoplanes sp. NBRC 103695]
MLAGAPGSGTRAVPARDQAILVLRWVVDGARMRQLATDNQISVSTGYDYLSRRGVGGTAGQGHCVFVGQQFELWLCGVIDLSGGGQGG